MVSLRGWRALGGKGISFNGRKGYLGKGIFKGLEGCKGKGYL